MSVYSGTKFAVRAISEGLRQEAGDKLRVTIISPGFVRTNFAESSDKSGGERPNSPSPEDKFAMPPDAIARAIAFAIEQPADVDVNEIDCPSHCAGSESVAEVDADWDGSPPEKVDGFSLASIYPNPQPQAGG